ncbi:dihydroorotase [Clostridium sp. JN-1]|uniref:dihydroorotase n=1 Tax=Clostridium sp. JN-1 TaxID=2483110 RepID=UPI000F0B89BB|nr:dihydroorotase [Clostridium sp. JN-1]
MELLIKNARIVDYMQDFVGDLYINNGKISEIDRNLNKNCEVIDANGLVLMPSFIDLHAHFRDPGLTYKEDIKSGSMAAVRGGYTLVNLMANTKPVCSSMSIVNYILKKAQEVGLVDIHQAVSITRDFNGHDISHLDDLDSRVKVISEDGKDVMDSKVMMDAMLKAKEKNQIVMCHCEESSVSNVDMRLSENMMTWRNLALSKFTGCHVHISHVSTKESMSYIIEAKRKGCNVTCEVTPHHIALLNSSYKVNPPIRDKEDVGFLINAIKDGWVDAIGTDHAPHTSEDKKNGAAGISGIETSFSICYTSLVKSGRISLNKLSQIMSKNPACIMKCKKGQIKVGYDADLVLVDLERQYKICSDDFKSKGKNTPFNGMNVYGDVLTTFRRGKVVYNSNKIGAVR